MYYNPPEILNKNYLLFLFANFYVQLKTGKNKTFYEVYLNFKDNFS